jgi:hypothetical protein
MRIHQDETPFVRARGLSGLSCGAGRHPVMRELEHQ